MILLFWLIALAGAAYFLFVPRRVDFYTVGYFGSTIYFLPGFLGHTLSVPTIVAGIRVRYPIPLLNGTYAVMLAVLVAVVVAAIVRDTAPRLVRPLPTLSGTRYLPHALVALAGVFLARDIAVLGAALLAKKAQLWGDLGLGFLIWTHAASIATVCAYAARKRWLAAAGVCLLVANLVIGNRTAPALTVVAVLGLRLSSAGRLRFVPDRWAYLPVVTGIGLFFFLAKGLYTAVKSGGALGILDRPLSITQALYYSEPFLTTLTLNEVLAQQFHIGFDHTRGLPYQLMVVPSYFGVSSRAFNEAFQPVLFPTARFGMAYSIWAEAMAAGGAIFLVCVILAYVAGLGVASWGIRSKDAATRAQAALMGSYWAFYIHRNSIATELTFERHLVYLFGAGWLASRVFTRKRLTAT
jgi:hypothetical protein